MPKPDKTSQQQTAPLRGPRGSRDQFGSSQIGDDDGGRWHADGIPDHDWQTFANDQFAESQGDISAEEQAAGAVFNRKGR